MILIRADANEIIGTGHVMRCLSLANAFSAIGEDVSFVTADHRGDELISRKGYQTICLDSDWTVMMGELDSLIHLVKDLKPSLMIVDSYYVTEEYFGILSPEVRIAYFDDMNSQKWDVDYLINYNIFANDMDYSYYSEESTKLLLGPEFAPLREEFVNLPQHKTKQNITDVMVSAGGADPERITEKLISSVCSQWQDINFHFIVGALNPRLTAIKSLECKNAILHIKERKMSDLMMKCDIAIAAAGTTLYELCACGIPTITYSLADNQLIAAEQFSAQGIMIDAGDCRNNDSFLQNIASGVRLLNDNNELRENISRKMQGLVDGSGAERLAGNLIRESN